MAYCESRINDTVCNSTCKSNTRCLKVPSRKVDCIAETHCIEVQKWKNVDYRVSDAYTWWCGTWVLSLLDFDN